MFNYFKKKIGLTIREKTLFVFIIQVVFLFALIAYMIYNALVIEERENKVNMASEDLKNIQKLINKELLDYFNRSNYMLSSGVILRFSMNYKENPTDYVKLNNSIDLIVKSFNYDYTGSADSLFKFYIEKPEIYETKYIKSFEHLKEKADVDRILNHTEFELVWEDNVDEKGDIVFYRNVSALTDIKCVLEVCIPIEKISYYIDNQNTTSASNTYILNSKNDLVFGEKGEYEKLEKFEIELSNGYKLVTEVKKQNLQGNVVLFGGVSLFLLLILTLVMKLLQRISINITKDLEGFVKSLECNEEIGSEYAEAINGDDEVSIVKKRMHDLVVNIKKLNEENTKTYKKAVEFEKELLQTQINPHLLYNSLSVVKWSALNKGDEKMAHTIDTMTKYYQLVLSKGVKLITIQDELNMVEKFVSINGLLENKEYSLVINADETVRAMYILKLMLQPFIENSIIHGLNGVDNPVIVIDVKREGDSILICITDNGYGIPEETLEKIRQFKCGYGILNTVKRMNLYFNNNCAFDIQSEYGEETKVQLKIPMISEGE